MVYVGHIESVVNTNSFTPYLMWAFSFLTGQSVAHTAVAFAAHHVTHAADFTDYSMADDSHNRWSPWRFSVKCPPAECPWPYRSPSPYSAPPHQPECFWLRDHDARSGTEDTIYTSTHYDLDGGYFWQHFNPVPPDQISNIFSLWV